MSLYYFARHRPFHNLIILFIAHEAREPHLRALVERPTRRRR